MMVFVYVCVCVPVYLYLSVSGLGQRTSPSFFVALCEPDEEEERKQQSQLFLPLGPQQCGRFPFWELAGYHHTRPPAPPLSLPASLPASSYNSHSQSRITWGPAPPCGILPLDVQFD